MLIDSSVDYVDTNISNLKENKLEFLLHSIEKFSKKSSKFPSKKSIKLENIQNDSVIISNN